MFQQNHEASELREAIYYERLAISAWEKLVQSAGDVYCDNLMMGNPKADLCGSWGDELPGLNADLAKLTAQLKEIFAENTPGDEARFRI